MLTLFDIIDANQVLDTHFIYTPYIYYTLHTDTLYVDYTHIRTIHHRFLPQKVSMYGNNH